MGPKVLFQIGPKDTCRSCSYLRYLGARLLPQGLEKKYNVPEELMADCLFCRIVRREIPAAIVYEDEVALVFKDINAQAPTHVLVIPKKHLDSLSASSDSDLSLLGHLQRTAAKVAQTMNLSFFRLVTNNGRGAGQSVDHLHYHLLGGRPLLWPPG